MDDSKVMIVGANGQLGQALHAQYPNAKKADIYELNITDRESVLGFDWTGIEVILNAAAFTNVDAAETEDGRLAAWEVNATAVGYLSEVARIYSMTLVHISTDYVFDGTKDLHTEDEALAPLSVYGASKAAGDLLIAQLEKYYILRTSWVIGEGNNFVRTMLRLAEKGVSPTVVADQIGRLTFTSELVRGIVHLLNEGAPFGTYNVTNEGTPTSWAEITRRIFKLSGHNELTVTDTSTTDYFAGKVGVALRPLQSTLNLAKIQATGFTSRDWEEDLKSYIEKELS